MQKTTKSPQSEEAEYTYSKAAKAELGKKYDIAFRLYIKAAEIFLHLSRSNNAREQEKSKWKTSASKALERAEKIKAFTQQQATSPTNNQSGPENRLNMTLTPVAVDHFSEREQYYVLQKGSVVNGLKFPMWDEGDPGTKSTSLYEDPDGQPGLSPEQVELSTVWRRPDALANVEFLPLGSDPKALQIRAQEIVQQVVTDCSVCASLSVSLEHSRRFSLSSPSCLYYSPKTGRCDVKVLWNGACRRVFIDDKLPYHPSLSSLTCMTCRIQEGFDPPRPVLWPSLIEKAYMKLMGGYNFPGSNSCIDLHAFGGWIPEQLDIQSSNFEREKTWSKLLEGFTRGDCVLTLGTGARPDIRWDTVDILSSHSYAVIDVEEEDEERVLTVLDPWISPEDDKQESRILRILWSDVLVVFDGIYISWDRRRWKNTLTFHGQWKKNACDNGCTRQLRANFSVTDNTVKEDEIWVLLTRHLSRSRETSEFIALQVEADDDNIKVCDNRLLSAKGVYTNSTHVLVKSRISKNQPSGTLVILASYDGKSQDVGFTLTVYARSAITISWNTDVPIPPFTTEIESTFTLKNAGGNSTFPTYMVNPQYHLRIHPMAHIRSKSKVSLTMHTVKDLPVNITVVWSQGHRVFELAEKDVVSSSGAYSYGLARLSQLLGAGDYNVILSSLEPHKTGPYCLMVESTSRFDFTPIPQEGVGMYSRVIRGAWNADTAVGGPSFKQYAHNPIYEVDCPSAAQMKVRLQLIRPSSSSPLNVAIYPADASEYTASHLATSGAYDDAISGVVTPQISLNRGKYWIIPSTFNPGIEAAFQLIVYSSVSGVEVELRSKGANS
ncbi:cysteine proteinase [Guyanagaster necrorhizus]|uniref:Cysteine proteinase n=1 Tax=Guyanagaster necrorhizus TaxID=856835 RepID=A0A9P8AW88_9AGAR|nr:cysteine proteinase [Guyanagaster necrorhizus MCA 3950]KAG7449916.1 cysteine proteinase [Guyanagaster necrorhizus MCA 3950]